MLYLTVSIITIISLRILHYYTKEKLNHLICWNLGSLKAKNKTQYLSESYKGASKLYKTINNINSRASHTNILLFTKVNLKTLLNKLLYNTEKHFFFNQKNISFNVSYDDNLPLHFIADEEKLKYAIELLLDYEIKSAFYNDEINIRINLYNDNNYILFCIENNSICISDNDKLTLQLSSHSYNIANIKDSTTANLETVYSIINAHNGAMWAKVLPSSNKIFSINFTIPINNQSNDSLELEVREIVCIDDDLTVISSYQLLLNYKNYKNVYFTSPLEALKYINKNFYKVDLILLDLVMPEMHGFEVLSLLRSFIITKNIPVIINSCISNIKEIHNAFDLGANDYIQKPFTYKKIHNVLSNYLSKQ